MGFTFLPAYLKCDGEAQNDEAVLMNSIVLKRGKGKLATKDIEGGGLSPCPALP